jgi:hypothetical protein
VKKMESPLTQLAEHWQDTTAQMRAASTGWASSTVDAFVNVVKTGKINFGSLVDQVATDLLKISLQKSMGGGLQVGYDALTKGFGNLIGGNGKDEEANPGGAISGAASSVFDFLKAPIDGVSKLFAQLTGKGADYSATVTDNVKNLVVGTTANTTTQSSVVTLGNAALYAAQALASIGGGGGGSSGIMGAIGGIASAAIGAYFGGSTTAGALGATNSMDTGAGSGGLFGTSAGTNTLGNYSYAGGSMSNQYKFANGGIMSEFGPLALRKYANGGVASSPQVAIYGEGSMNEAFVPLPDGKSIPVTMSGGNSGGGGGVENIQVNVINQSGTAVQGQQQGAPRFDGKQMILDVVLTAVSSPGSFRDQMRGNMK